MHSPAKLVPARRRTVTRAARALGSGAVVMAVGVVSALPGTGPAAAVGFHTDRVSVATAGTQANWSSLSSAISADGRFVAFDSSASNLVAGDTNGVDDVFLRDRRTRTTTRISTSYTGGATDAASGDPAVSHDGRYVAFSSTASNLVRGDTNEFRDMFVRDTRTGVTERVSVSSTGAQADGDNYDSSISGDGRFVVFSTTATNLAAAAGSGVSHVMIHDRRTHTTELVSVSYRGSTTRGGGYWGSVSMTGRYVAFASWESTIVPDDTNNTLDVFVRDLVTGITTRASMAENGAQSVEFAGSPTVSADGRYVAFASADSTLVAGDTNGAHDVFVRDLWAGTTRRVSQTRAGEQADNVSDGPQLTPDGRHILFTSAASNLVPGDINESWDIFVQDLRTRRSVLVSRASSGAPGDGDSWNGRISADASHVVYGSAATNLVRGDTNEHMDIFVTDRLG